MFKNSGDSHASAGKNKFFVLLAFLSGFQMFYTEIEQSSKEGASGIQQQIIYVRASGIEGQLGDFYEKRKPKSGKNRFLNCIKLPETKGPDQSNRDEDHDISQNVYQPAIVHVK
jgi:hypothetical protein